MKTLLLLAALSCSAIAGTRSILQTDGGSFAVANLNATAPNSAPYSTAGDERIELRLSGWDTAATSNDWVVWFHSCLLLERRSSDQYLRISDQCDGNQSNDIALNITGAAWSGKDIVVRLQRVMSDRTFTVGVWTAQRTTYLSGSNGFGLPTSNDRNYRNGNLLFGGQRASGNLAWVRWYSTTVPEVETTPPLETGPTGDLGNWEFEDGGSGTITCASSTAYDDGSGNSLTITPTGTQTCSNTPTYDPYVTAGPHVTAVVGRSSALAGSCTPLNGSATTTLLWTQDSGPNTLTLSSTSVAAPTFSNQVETLTGKASYHFTLSCTDSSMNSSTSTTVVGAVPVTVTVSGEDNINYESIYPATAVVLGPIARTTPWGFYNVADPAVMTLVAETMQDPDYVPARGAALGTGSVDVDASGRIVCTNSCTSGLSPGDFVFIGWTPPGFSAGSGNMNASVASIQNATTFTLDQLSGYLCASPPCSGVAAEIYHQPAETATYSAVAWGLRSGSLNNNWNYYDMLMALQRTFLRTGDDTYWAGINAMCTKWNDFALDHGYSGAVPRVRALAGVMGGCFEMQGITTAEWANLSANFIIPQFSQELNHFPATNFNRTDDREAGYGVRDAAIASILDPDGTRHTAYCTNLDTALTNISNGITVIDADHAYPNQDEFSFNTSYPYVPPGNSGWRLDIMLQGLRAMYESYHSADGCNDGTNAALALDISRRIINWVRDYAIYEYNGHLAPFYDVGYASNGQIGAFGGNNTTLNGSIDSAVTSLTLTDASRFAANIPFTIDSEQILCTSLAGNNFSSCTRGYNSTTPASHSNGAAVAGTYTVSGTMGSTAIVGTGTHFTADVSVGDFIGLRGPTVTLNVGQVYRIASITDDTHLDIDTNYPNANFSDSTITWGLAASGESCGTSLANYCNADPAGPYNLARLLPMIFGWYAYRSGDASYLAQGDGLFASFAGGPADGPGGALACSGPGCSDTLTDWTVLLPACSTNAPPCYPGGGLSNLGKNFAQGAGAAGGITYVGYRNLVSTSGSGAVIKGNPVFKGNVVFK